MVDIMDNVYNVTLTQNDTDEEDAGIENLVRITGYIVPVVFAVIFLVGLLGNSILIIIVLRNKNMRTTPNILIVSLALGDLLLIVISVPFYSVMYTSTNWSYGEFLCKMNGALKALSLGVSVFTLTALSVDRYVASMFPMRRHKSPMPKTPIVASGIWVLSLGLAALEGTVHEVSELSYNGSAPIKVCHADRTDWGSWFPCGRALFRFVVYFGLPMVIIGVLYSLMARSLWLSRCDVPLDSPPLTGTGPAAARQAKARKKIAKLVLAIVFLFIVCWLPRHIYLLWFHCEPVGGYNMFWYVWKILSFCLCFINSSINPLALYILSDQFRRYYNLYLFCGWRQEQEQEPRPRAGTNPWQTASLSTFRSKRQSTDLLNGATNNQTNM